MEIKKIISSLQPKSINARDMETLEAVDDEAGEGGEEDEEDGGGFLPEGEAEDGGEDD